MKLTCIILSFILSLLIQLPISAQETTIKGFVHQWPTDTVYLCELPFHSPYSYNLYTYIIKKDNTFQFYLDKEDKPFNAFISPSKKVVEQQLESLLFNNLTDEHYWGHCSKVYANGKSTFLIDPNIGLDIELTYTSWPEKVSPRMYEMMKKAGATTVGDDQLLQIGTIEIKFNHKNPEQYKFYQTSFEWDNKCDMALSKPSSKKISRALINLKSTKEKLRNKLEDKKSELSPAFYDYLLAEIEFGAKKEFFKYLKYEKEDYLKEIISSGNIPAEIAEVIVLDQSILSEVAMISEEYIEYAEFYINFLMNLQSREYKAYHPLSKEKLKLASEELPPFSFYYYVTNQLLHNENIDEYKDYLSPFLNTYPDGELNEKLKAKYSIN